LRMGARFLFGVLSCVMLSPVCLGTAAAQGAPAFTFAPKSGPIGTTITINGSCGPGAAEDAIGLYHMPDDDLSAQVDVVTGITGASWTRTLTVKPQALQTGGQMRPTTNGLHEIHLYCDIGSNYRPPDTPVGPEGGGGSTLRSDAEVIHTFTVGSALPVTDGGVAPVATERASVPEALPVGPTSSRFPLPVTLAVAAVVVAAVGLFFVRRPLLAAVQATTAPSQRDVRRPDRRDDGGHAICATTWTAASASSEAVRKQAGQQLGRALQDAGAKWTALQSKLDAASDAFAGLRDGKRQSGEDASSEELIVARRILDGLAKAIEGKR
jgi:hypothetical protein